MSKDKFEQKIEKMENAREFLEYARAEVQRRKDALGDKGRAFFESLLSSFTSRSSLSENRELTELWNAITKENMKPSKALEKYIPWVISDIIPESMRQSLLHQIDSLPEYPFSTSYGRRSYRSCRYTSYGPRITLFLSAWLLSPIYDYPFEDRLSGNLPKVIADYCNEHPYMSRAYEGFEVAYALDNSNKRAEETVRRIICEQNSGRFLTRELIQGVLMSHRPDFHKLIAELLLAARLQEGLRQSICESADFGSREGFISIVKVIKEHDLMRFSSVKRAVGVWLGLMSEETRDLDRIGNKSIELIYDCLTDEGLRREYLSGEDSMKIYIALWSIGVGKIEDAIEAVERIEETGTHHQRLTAYYFLSSAGDRKIEFSVFKRLIKNRYGEDDSLAIMLSSFGYIDSVLYSKKNGKSRAFCYEVFESADEARAIFALLAERADTFSARSKVIEGCVFPWNSIELKKSDICEKLCAVAAASVQGDLIDIACSYLPNCSADNRGRIFGYMLSRPESEIQRRTVIECIADKESMTRSRAVAVAPSLALTAEEYALCESYLRLKNAETRQCAEQLLLGQDDSALGACISRLISASKEDMRLGGLELISLLLSDSKRKALGEKFFPELKKMLEGGRATAKEMHVLEAILPKKEEEKGDSLYTEEDRYLPQSKDIDPQYLAAAVTTFLKYFPDSDICELIGQKKGVFAAIFGSKSSGALDEARKGITELSKFIDDRKNDIYKSRWGEECPLGSGTMQQTFRFDPEDEDMIIPAFELWKSYLEENKLTNGKILRMLVLSRAYKAGSGFGELTFKYISSFYGKGFEEGIEVPYGRMIAEILEFYMSYVTPKEKELLGAAFAFWFVLKVPAKDVVFKKPAIPGFVTSPEYYNYGHFITHQQFALLHGEFYPRGRENIKSIFNLGLALTKKCIEANAAIPYGEDEKELERKSGYKRPVIRSLLRGGRGRAADPALTSTVDYLIAVREGIISERAFFEFAFRPECVRDSLGTLSMIATLKDKGRVIAKNSLSYWDEKRRNVINTQLFGENGFDRDAFGIFYSLYERMLSAVLEREYARADSHTDQSAALMNVKRAHGSEIFAKTLAALGSDKLVRSSYYSGALSRATTLTHILSVTVPRADEEYSEFEAAMKDKKITQKRLIEAALFSPEWIPFIGRFLGIADFEQGAYYFIAHMNESFDSKREAMIARYTHLSPDELNVGAFDRAWFESAYESLGEKTFSLLYDAAKYITDGIKHARARKYADACLGKYGIDELEAVISDKRNKDLLMAYALLPGSGEDDIVRRYLFINKFKKESKNFGSQRAQSEKLCAETALVNLAATAGYRDSMRLSLRMETKLAGDSADLLEGKTVEGVFFKIDIDACGRASLSVTKEGRELKSIPAKLKKNEEVLRFTAFKKLLAEQYSRTRRMLEEAMENRSEFTGGEIVSLSSHPVVAPMLRRLVLISGDLFGFAEGDGLRGINGEIYPVGEKVRIAHPYDLYESGNWRAFQKHLFDTETVQPIKQVFRELYLKVPEELGKYRSLRYAGNQILPRKTAAVLKGRRWVADIENGLQKVYYSENIVASIFALADWFTPSDIEAPTLEYVVFFDRKSGAELKIDDIPDIVFSEVMRDVDLAVSSAHAGGVDPEASRSTVEMRAAILSYILPLFKLGNVKVEKNHAYIEGKLAGYTVHLGSGVVHKQGGSMIPVLPVHSAHRGRIFLPFIDDDPKTSEIISKVLLFAEDERIKDPAILSEIART